MAHIAQYAAALAVICGATCCAVLAPMAIGGVASTIQRARGRARITGDKQASLHSLLFEDACRNGIPPLRPIAQLLLRSPFIATICSKVADKWRDRANVVISRCVCEMLLFLSLVCAVLVLVVFKQWLLALLVFPAIFWVAYNKAIVWQKAQKTLMREQIPDALRAIGMCFSAGFSLMQALEQSAKEAPKPFGKELIHTADDMKTGYSVDDALAGLESRTEIGDLHFVAVALEIQHRTGGSLKDLLDNAADSVSASFELQRSLEVQTAQARMSARVVTFMPIALVAVLSLVMDNYLQTFFSSAAGFTLLLVAAAMEITGIVLIRKILGIDLD